jgi:hypothetical protein
MQTSALPVKSRIEKLHPVIGAPDVFKHVTFEETHLFQEMLVF